eukprot:5160719-Pyramimonas_sp.AAC.1
MDCSVCSFSAQHFESFQGHVRQHLPGPHSVVESFAPDSGDEDGVESEKAGRRRSWRRAGQEGGQAGVVARQGRQGERRRERKHTGGLGDGAEVGAAQQPGEQRPDQR